MELEGYINTDNARLQEVLDDYYKEKAKKYVFPEVLLHISSLVILCLYGSFGCVISSSCAQKIASHNKSSCIRVLSICMIKLSGEIMLNLM